MPSTDDPTTFDYAPARLAELFSDVGDRLAKSVAAGTRDAMGAIAAVADEIVPGSEFASISQGRKGVFSTVGQTDAAALDADSIQYELGSGPCVDAALEDAVFRTGDLPHDTRWPAYGPLAFERQGVMSMLSTRLFLENDDRIASINIYSRQPDAFSDVAQTIAMIIATHGSLAIIAAGAFEKANHLAQALESNREIGVAVGILMTQYKLTRTQAFDLLVMGSQHSNRKLAAVALDVIDTGTVDLSVEARNRYRR